MRTLKLGILFLILATSVSVGTAEESTPSVVPAEPVLPGSFEVVAEQVYPAVVSVISVHVQRLRAFRQPNSSQGDAFDGFFKEFFGGVPEREFRYTGLGSGVIVDERGYILTNYHVVEGADEVTIRLPDGREFMGALHGADPRSDLAVVKIKAENLPIAKLGNSDQVKVGSWAVAIGNPFGFLNDPQPSMTLGVISALHRSLPQYEEGNRYYGNLIQTDAAINRGNSGGPLVNIRGEVIGINTAIFATPGGGYIGAGFAIPINRAREVLDDLIAGKEIAYGWLGVNVQDVDQAFADYFQMPDANGVLIARVHSESPAEKGGLLEGDIIRFYDGQRITGTHDLIQKVGRAPVGKTIKIIVFREGKEVKLNIKIGERPVQVVKQVTPPDNSDEWRGIHVAELSEEAAEAFNISDFKGVFVESVDPRSQAAAAGLEHGDVIIKINRKPIGSLEEFREVTSKIKDNALIRTARGYFVVNAEADSKKRKRR